MSKIITCEQVSNGHPDKICDQIAAAIVTDILQHDKNARVAIECLLKKNQLFIAGEVTTDYQPNYQQLVHEVITRIGADKMGFDFGDLLRIGILVDKQSPDIALGVDKGGAGDQGIMYGYATNETAEQMPIPYMVATKFLQLLKAHPSRMFRADAKAQVSYDYDTGRITTFLCSVQHSPDVEVNDFRHIIESMMVLAAIGVVQPVGVSVECFGTEHEDIEFIQAYINDSYDLTPQGIIKRLGLLDVDYNKVSAYGHFGKAGLPWEE